LDPWNRKNVLKSTKIIDERLECKLWDKFVIGRELTNIQKVMGYGKYERYREETWGDRLKRSKAWYCKKFYEDFKDHPELVRTASTTFLLDMVNQDFPLETREVIIEHFNQLDKKDGVNIRKEFQGVKEGRTKKEDFNSYARSIVTYKAKKLSVAEEQRKKLRDEQLEIESFKEKIKTGISNCKAIKVSIPKIADDRLGEVAEHCKLLVDNYEEGIDLLRKRLRSLDQVHQAS